MASFEETGGDPVNELRFPTPKEYADFLLQCEQSIKELGDISVTACGMGVPGKLDRSTGVVISCGNLNWKNAPVKQDIADLLHCPVFVENDAKVGGLSEAMFVINDFKNILYVPIGTGIGIANIIDGVIDTQYGDRGGKDIYIDSANKQTDWESVASGSAIVRQFGKMARDITDEVTWKTIAHNISVGLEQLINSRRPEAVIIGGGVGKHFDRFGDLVKMELAQSLDSVPAILPAKHSEQAVLYGCLELIKQNHGRTA